MKTIKHILLTTVAIAATATGQAQDFGKYVAYNVPAKTKQSAFQVPTNSSLYTVKTASFLQQSVQSIHRKSFFSVGFIQKYKLQGKLNQLQFYTTGSIVLTEQGQVLSDVQIKDGGIVAKEHDTYSKVVIKAYTPCTVDSVLHNGAIVVRFGDGVNEVLVFVPNASGDYSLAAKGWNKEVGQLVYAGKDVQTNDGTVKLRVKTRKLHKLGGKVKVVTGHKL